MIALHRVPVDPDCWWKSKPQGKAKPVVVSQVQRHHTTFERDYIAALVQLSHQEATVIVRGKFKKVPITAINGVRIAQQIADAKL